MSTHYRLDQSDASTVALCARCSWRTIASTSSAARAEAQRHVAEAHLTPKQTRDMRRNDRRSA